MTQQKEQAGDRFKRALRVTTKAIAKDPAERYQSCTEFAYDLRVALRGLTETIIDEKIKGVVDYVHHL